MPLVVLTGEDRYRREKAVGELRARYVSPDFQAFSHRVLRQPSTETIIEVLSATALGLMGDTLVEIHAYEYGQKAVPDFDLSNVEAMKAMIESAPPTQHIVFVFEKLNKTYKFGKWLVGKHDVEAMCQQFDVPSPFKPQEAVDLLLAEAKVENIALQPAAAALMVEHLGHGLDVLMNKLSQLALAFPGQTLTPALVKPWLPPVDSSFALLKCFTGEQPKAVGFPLLVQLLQHQHPMQLFAFLQGQLSQVTEQKMLAQYQQLSPDEIGAQLGMHPYRVKLQLQALSKVSVAQLCHMQQQLVQAEYATKTGLYPDAMALESVLAQ